MHSVRSTGAIRFLCVGGIALLSVLTVPSLAGWSRATADVEQAARVLDLNRDAMEMFSELEVELAERMLVKAAKLVKKAGLETHPVAVKTLGNLGIVFAVGHKNEQKAVQFFADALVLKPGFALPENASPEAHAALALARGSVDGSDSTASAETEPVETPEPQVTELQETEDSAGVPLRCPTSGTVPAGDDITLRCVTAASLRPQSVVMFYRVAGAETFVEAPMEGETAASRKAVWTGSIPGDQVTGKWLPYYFEARNGAGETLAQSGRFESPSLLAIEASETVASGPVAAGHDNPLVAKGLAPAPTESRSSAWFVNLGFGSGVGFAAGEGVEAYRDQAQSFTPGVAGYGLGHALPEIGYFLNDTFAVSLQARLQFIPRPDTITAGGAMSALARALFFSSASDSRFYGAVALGGGEGFRMVVDTQILSGHVVQDTVRGGPIVAGAGGGYVFDFSQSEGGTTFGWMIESNALVGFPDFSVGLDVNTGLQIGF